MATILQGTCSRSTISLTTEFGHWELPNDPEKHNTKSLSIFLRACCHPETGKPLFTSQHIADALGYNDRQDTNNFWRQCEASGKQFRDFLQRKMKVDDTVVDAVEKEVRKDLQASASTLGTRQKINLPKIIRVAHIVFVETTSEESRHTTVRGREFAECSVHTGASSFS